MGGGGRERGNWVVKDRGGGGSDIKSTGKREREKVRVRGRGIVGRDEFKKEAGRVEG